MISGKVGGKVEMFLGSDLNGKDEKSPRSCLNASRRVAIANPG